MNSAHCIALSGICLAVVCIWAFGNGAKAGTTDPHVVPFILGPIIFAIWAGGDPIPDEEVMHWCPLPCAPARADEASK